MKAEEKRCTVDGELVSLGTKPVYGAFLRADIDEVITDEQEDIVTGACCVRGDVAELLYRFLDCVKVRHIIRVDHECGPSGGLTLWTAHGLEKGGSGRIRDLPSRGAAPQKCGWDRSLWFFISHDMNTQLDHINDLLEKDSELRDVCDLLHSGVLSHQSTENKGRSS